MTFFSLLQSRYVNNNRSYKVLGFLRLPLSSKPYVSVDKTIYKRATPLLDRFSIEQETSFNVIHQGVALHIKARSLKGFQHLFNLPVNGQRTKTNACTRRRAKAPKIGLRKKKAKPGRNVQSRF
uniref:Ribosomal protein S13 n=1 Tax=Balamuthia mandrillaris TaxID=66527 RepID=A0A0K1HRZ6_9EUKA|nr:30S ribosomal protein S13 [Balamuthia mandrillaris]AKT93843.1 ribsomal protein S13 [Balamuthia mandrillaris]AKT94961.1 ribosomal protein S13 [Balamuthia mandrillaris]AKT94977.1 ribosomal protein S13 [Balamuthia mandrillaris]AKT95016.1 ribosomal protein S13 [Balamuthia mandrillaris]